MKYKLLESDSDALLEQVVNDHIAEGWQPLGGVSVVRWEDAGGYTAWQYTQAMVRADLPQPVQQPRETTPVRGMNPILASVRITYQSMVVRCELHRSRKENELACLQALAILTGLTVEQLQDPECPEGLKQTCAKIEGYRSY